MSLKDVIEPLVAALKTADGAQVGERTLLISEQELATIYEAYKKPAGWLERSLGGFTSRVVRSQIKIVRDGLKLSGAVLDDRARAKHAADVNQLESLLDFLESINRNDPPAPEQMYAKYVALVASVIDG